MSEKHKPVLNHLHSLSSSDLNLLQNNFTKKNVFLKNKKVEENKATDRGHNFLVSSIRIKTVEYRNGRYKVYTLFYFFMNKMLFVYRFVYIWTRRIHRRRKIQQIRRRLWIDIRRKEAIRW